MTTKYNILILVCVTIILTNSISVLGQIQRVRIYGTYQSNVPELDFFITKIQVNKNNTFTYKFSGDLLSDTSAGTYYLVKDTIYFTYKYNDYDSIYRYYKENNKPIPFEIVLSDNSSHLRPRKLLWENDKMFEFHSVTGEVVREGINNGKKIEIYLGHIK